MIRNLRGKTVQTGAKNRPERPNLISLRGPAIPKFIVAHGRLLTPSEAAAHCGLSKSMFLRVCPVPALAMSSNGRLQRYDRKALDDWIDRLSATGNEGSSADWLDLLDL